MKFDLDKNKKLIIGVLVALFVIFTIIRVVVMSLTKDNKNDNDTSTNTQNTSQVSKTNEDTERLKEIKKKSEGERVRTYLGEYFKFLEKKDYESAYNLLYSDFKQNYFPTLEKYREYIEKCGYPDMLAIKYNDVKRVGYFYIVTLDINNLDPDAIISKQVVKTGTKFVVKENDYDDFYLSFQL